MKTMAHSQARVAEGLFFRSRRCGMNAQVAK
jgi:hypothetical protein